MSVFYTPSNHRDLSECIALVALNPKRFHLQPDGCLALAKDSRNRRITSVFQGLVSQFRRLKDAKGHNSTDTLRCREGLYALASRDETGCAMKLLGPLASRVREVALRKFIPVETLTAAQCQQALSTLFYEKQFAISTLGFFSGIRRVLELIEKAAEMGGMTVYDRQDAIDIFPIEGLSPHMLAVILRYSTVNKTGGRISSHRIDEDQLSSVLKEAQQLGDEKLLNEEDNKYIEVMQKTCIKKKIRSMSDRFGYIDDFNNVLNAKSLSADVRRPQEAIFLDSAVRHLREVAFKGFTSDIFELDEVNGIIQRILPYIRQLHSAEIRYEELYAQLRTLTKHRSQIRFRKLITDLDTAIPLERDFSSSWRWDVTQEKKHAPVRAKRKKRTKPKSKRKARKPAARPLRQPEIPAAKDQTRAERVAEASPSPLPAAAAASHTPAMPKQVPPPIAQGYQYAERVLRFLDPSHPGRTRDQIEHGFGIAVDDFVESLGVRTIWSEQDTLFSIPGEMEYQGEVHRGVFTYCFDGTTPNRCYHRCFMRKPADEMVAEFSDKGFWEFDFPQLNAEHRESYPASERARDGSRVIKEYRNVVEVKDPRNSATIRLFKVKS